MATPTSQDLQDQLNIGKALEESLKSSKRLQNLTADQNVELDRGLKLLMKTNEERDKILSNLASFEKSTINIKKIETEKQKAVKTEELSKLKILEFEEKLGGQGDVRVQQAHDYVKLLAERIDLEKLLEEQVKTTHALRAAFDAQNAANVQDHYEKIKQAEAERATEESIHYTERLAKRTAEYDLYDSLLANATESEKQQLEEDHYRRMEYIQSEYLAQVDAADHVFNTKKAHLDDELKVNSDLLKETTGLAKAEISQKDTSKRLGDLYNELTIKEETLDVDQRALAAHIQSQQVASETVAHVNQQLEAEKQLKKEVGLTGKLLQLSNKYIGVGGELHKKLVEEARDGNSVTSNGIKAFTILGAAIVGATKLVGYLSDNLKGLAGIETGGPVSKLLSPVNDLIKNIPIVGGAIAGLIDVFAGVLDLAISTTSNIQKMGRELSLSKEEAIALNAQFSDFANTNSNVLFNSRKLFESQVELSSALGVSNVLSSDILAKNIQMKEIADLELETRQSITESSVLTGKSMDRVAMSVFAQVRGLKEATGINFNNKQILGEAAKLGGYLGLQFAKYPAQLAKSLVTVKAMGLELKQLDGIADSFLDFESSISNEFEAQLLTGRDINMNKARELFLNNDLAGAAAEITSQVGSSAEFMKMNRIQAESWAKNFGMTRDQMGDMLKKQELLSRLGAKDTDNAQKQYELGLKRYKTQALLSEAIGKEAYDNLVSANAQEKIAGLIEKIKQGFADLIANSGIMNFIDRAINFLSQPDSIQWIVEKLKNFFGTIVQVMGTLIGGLMRAVNLLPGVNIGLDMIEMVESAGSRIKEQKLGFLSEKKRTERATESSKIEPVTPKESPTALKKTQIESVENNLVKTETVKPETPLPSQKTLAKTETVKPETPLPSQKTLAKTETVKPETPLPSQKTLAKTETVKPETPLTSKSVAAKTERLEPKLLESTSKFTSQIESLNPITPNTSSIAAETTVPKEPITNVKQQNQVSVASLKDSILAAIDVSSAAAKKEINIQQVAMSQAKESYAKNEPARSITIKNEFKVGSRDYTDLIQNTLSENYWGKSDGNLIFTTA